MLFCFASVWKVWAVLTWLGRHPGRSFSPGSEGVNSDERRVSGTVKKQSVESERLILTHLPTGGPAQSLHSHQTRPTTSSVNSFLTFWSCWMMKSFKKNDVCSFLKLFETFLMRILCLMFLVYVFTDWFLSGSRGLWSTSGRVVFWRFLCMWLWFCLCKSELNKVISGHKETQTWK